MSEDNRALIDNIIKTDPEFFKNAVCLDTKERMVKEGLLRSVREIIQDLNDSYPDIKFRYKWGVDYYRTNEQFHPLVGDLYDEDYNSDMEDFDGVLDIDEELDALWETPLIALGLKITYFWSRRCSLGCDHLTKRFRVMYLPTLISLIAGHRIKLPVSVLVNEYLPDVFDVPKKKTKRPRKS